MQKHFDLKTPEDVVIKLESLKEDADNIKLLLKEKENEVEKREMNFITTKNQLERTINQLQEQIKNNTIYNEQRANEMQSMDMKNLRQFEEIKRLKDTIINIDESLSELYDKVSSSTSIYLQVYIYNIYFFILLK